MAAPKVQSIEQIIKSYNPAYQGSIDVVKARQAQLPGQFLAQQQALDAEKVEGFNQINEQMVGRGLSFSGIAGHEQSNYLSTKYLPGMQMLKQQENEQRLALDESLATINKERRLAAMTTREAQQKSLQDYLAEQRQRAWEKQKFAAEQAMERAKMAQQARESAADRAASARNTAASTPSKYAAVNAMLMDAADKNGKVSKGAWGNIVATAYNQYGIKFGGDNGFASKFWNYAAHGNYKDGYKQYMK